MDRFPTSEEHNWISVTPDWTCEILSPRTAKIDKHNRMSIYTSHGVPHAPVIQTFDGFRLKTGQWVVPGLYTDDDRVRVEPLPEIEIDLKILWLE